ncbi:MAG: hypothetical protein KY433_11710 [Actinobacteria bacterium]|nr:hypothetical protein [Actinomycetota bacterium]
MLAPALGVTHPLLIGNRRQLERVAAQRREARAESFEVPGGDRLRKRRVAYDAEREPVRDAPVAVVQLAEPVLLAARLALGLAVAWLLVRGEATAAFIVAVFLALSFAYVLREDPRPHLFDALFALAALLGALGYVFELFDAGVPYDEPIHAFTTFSVSLAFFFLFYQGAVPRQRAIALTTSVFTLGVTVGALWEIFEWYFVDKFTMADTIGDLIADSLGALAAASVALFIRRRGERLT